MSINNSTVTYTRPDLSAPLTPDTVLNYFCDPANPFYERSCDNQTLFMQNRPMTHLEQMTGMQYMVESALPPLFVIRKHKRNSPADYTPTNYYYVLNGVISECPSIYVDVQTRLANCVSSLTQAMTSTLGMLRVSAVDGRKWQFETKPVRPRAALNEDDSAPTPTDLSDSAANSHVSHSRLVEPTDPFRVRTTLFQRLHTQRALQMLMERFPSKTKISLPNEQPPAQVRETVAAKTAAAGPTANTATGILDGAKFSGAAASKKP